MKVFHILLLIVIITNFLLVIALGGFFREKYCENVNKYLHIFNKDKTTDGYTLITPFSGVRNSKGQYVILLVNNYGKPVHYWFVKYPPLYAILKQNGNILVAQKDQQKKEFPLRGRYGILEELNWSSTSVWRYENFFLHHDFIVLPNGNVMAHIWEPLQNDIAQTIKGGVSGSEYEGKMWSSAVIEINSIGNIVSTWHPHENLDMETISLSFFMPRSELFHANSLSYIQTDPFEGQEAFLISMRDISTIFMVNKNTGRIIWHSPKDMVNLQHDATYLKNGNILVLDNSPLRIQHPDPWYGSRVIEINPKTNKVIWEFDGGESLTQKARFFVRVMGGAQRLANGNTLIVNGVDGNILEVTHNKEVVWNWNNSYGEAENLPFSMTSIFNAKKYTDREIRWPQYLDSNNTDRAFICR